jgi:hypothetical protein
MARLVLLVLLASLPGFGQCVSISEASHHLGKKACVAGKVLKVTRAEHDVYLLHFCEDEKACPFVVRVFPIDFDYVGDVRQLAGKEIEITGKIKEWNRHSEIILKDADQLNRDAIKLPPTPKVYDAERRGNTSPGQLSGTRTTKRSHKPPTSDSPGDPDSE